jgi:hypothetical protein
MPIKKYGHMKVQVKKKVGHMKVQEKRRKKIKKRYPCPSKS